jgi:hypothetical protein
MRSSVHPYIPGNMWKWNLEAISSQKKQCRSYSFLFSMGKDSPDTARGTRETTMFTGNMQIHCSTKSPCNETSQTKRDLPEGPPTGYNDFVIVNRYTDSKAAALRGCIPLPLFTVRSHHTSLKPNNLCMNRAATE